MLDGIRSAAAVVVVNRFEVSGSEADAFAARAREAIEAFSTCGGFVAAELAQSTDDPRVRMIVSRWEHIGAYRRALSAYDVKLRAIPLLYTAIDEPSAFEVVHARTPEGSHDAVSGLAADADGIGLGFAAAPEVPPVMT